MVLYMTVPLERDVVHSPNKLIYDLLKVEEEFKSKIRVVNSIRCRQVVQKHYIDGD